MDEILTLQEISAYLKLSDKTVLKMVKNGEIPCTKIANQWRFSKSIIDDWIIAKMNVIPQNDYSRLVQQEYDFIKVSRLIDEDLIIMDLKGSSVEEIIKELAQRATNGDLIKNRDEFIDKLLERERLTSTSIGQGIAIPHLRKPCGSIVSEPKIVIGFSREGVDFSSLDGEKTYIFLLLLSDSEVVHLKILSKLSQILTAPGNRDKLQKCETINEVIKYFIDEENSLTY